MNQRTNNIKGADRLRQERLAEEPSLEPTVKQQHWQQIYM